MFIPTALAALAEVTYQYQPQFSNLLLHKLRFRSFLVRVPSSFFVLRSSFFMHLDI